MDGYKKARLYHDFVILLLFTTVSPSRNADLMKLKILFDEEQGSVSENYILFKENGSTTMVVNDFKTKKNTGAIEWTSPVTIMSTNIYVNMLRRRGRSFW